MVAGDVCTVGDGTYTDTNADGVTLYINGNNGTVAAPLTFISTNFRGAKIINPSAVNEYGIYVARNNVVISGFDISGGGFDGDSNTPIGITSSSSNSGLLIERNYIHDVGHNCIPSSFGADGIFLGVGNDVTIQRNIFARIGRKFNGESGCSNPVGSHGDLRNGDHAIYVGGSTNLTIRNNLFINNTMGYSIVAYGSTVNNATIYNNTFYGGSPGAASSHVLLASIVNTAIVKNNLSNTPQISFIDRGDTSMLSNIVVAYNQSTTTIDNGTRVCTYSGVTCLNNVSNTPSGFVNAGAGDFHLQLTSAAKDSGLTLSEVTDDYDGVTRPQGTAYDKGAFEFVQAGSGFPPNAAVSPTRTYTVQ